MPHQFTQPQNISEPSITNSKSTVFPRLRDRLLFNKVKASPRILISPDKGSHHPQCHRRYLEAPNSDALNK